MADDKRGTALLESSEVAGPLERKTGEISLHAYQQVKTQVHRDLLNRIDLGRVMTMGEGAARTQIFGVIQELIRNLAMPLSGAERQLMGREILNEVFGLGPLEPLLQDPTIDDILVNTCKQVYVERAGKLEKTNVVFKDNAHLLQIIDRIVSAVGRRVDESSPMVDARLADGSRVNAVIPPLAVDGPILSIRRFGKVPLQMDDLMANRTLTPQMLELLKGAIKARLNILISGGTGAGKTTLLNILSGFISEKERIVTIEDSAELQLKQEHVVRLECRPPNVEGKGAVRQRQLVINALRMRPDRIVVGEVRGEEALDMLQAMNTGHDGSLTTIHANTPRDAISRLETMSLMANLNLPERAVRQQIASAIAVVVQIARMSDGTRRVTDFTEITGIDTDIISMQDIFKFEKKGIGPEGRVLGRFYSTGIRPRFADKLHASGLSVPASLFDHSVEI
ncbi:MAG TPA: CpaF family protein [Terriglobia bacterium]|nr:CpaF family protein [Terriglobia bacterium]